MKSRKTRYEKILKPLLPTKQFTMLDVGCGKMIHTRYFNFFKCTAVDVEQEYYGNNIRFIKSDAFNYLNSIKSIFDVVVGMNIIEHFKKEKSLELIELMKSRTKVMLMFQTSDGFIPNCQFQGLPYQSHLCGYSQEDLELLNFEVFRLENDMISFKRWFDKNNEKYPKSWDRLIGVWRK